jgi:hypothetical protein
MAERRAGVLMNARREECAHWAQVEDPKTRANAEDSCGICARCVGYAPEVSAADDFWGPPIYVYTRAQAIEDGVLVSLAKVDNAELGELCEEAGFRAPIAMTREVFMECVELTPAAKRAFNDVKGRLWDVLTMLKHAMRRPQPELLFKVLVVRERVRPTPTVLKCVLGPGDDGEAVITIMFPGQD